MFKTILYLCATTTTNASILQLVFVMLFGTVCVANAQEATHNQTPHLYLAEKITLSGTDNIHIVDVESKKRSSFLILSSLSSVTNATQIYVTEGTYTDFTSFASITKKVLTFADTRNSKTIQNIAKANATTTPTTVQSSAQYQATPIFPFLPIKFFSIEQPLSISSTPTYPSSTNKAIVNNAYSTYNNSEKLLKAAIAYNSRETMGAKKKQFRTHTFSLPPPFLG